MDAVTRRALDPLAALPTSHPLYERVLELPLMGIPAAALQLEGLPDVFTLTRRVCLKYKTLYFQMLCHALEPAVVDSPGIPPILLPCARFFPRWKFPRLS